MNELDVFIVSFGVAFFVASSRFKRLAALVASRITHRSNTRS